MISVYQSIGAFLCAKSHGAMIGETQYDFKIKRRKQRKNLSLRKMTGYIVRKSKKRSRIEVKVSESGVKNQLDKWEFS